MEVNCYFYFSGLPRFAREFQKVFHASFLLLTNGKSIAKMQCFVRIWVKLSNLELNQPLLGRMGDGAESKQTMLR